MYEKLMGETIPCDLCGMTDAEGIVYRSDNFIYLCSICMKKIEAAPESISVTLERIMMGNVL